LERNRKRGNPIGQRRCEGKAMQTLPDHSSPERDDSHTNGLKEKREIRGKRGVVEFRRMRAGRDLSHGGPFNKFPIGKGGGRKEPRPNSSRGNKSFVSWKIARKKLIKRGLFLVGTSSSKITTRQGRQRATTRERSAATKGADKKKRRAGNTRIARQS